MAIIVLDLSAQGRITIRPRNGSDELTDSPKVSTFWLRTPYGNAIYAFGPEGTCSRGRTRRYPLSCSPPRPR